MFFLSRSDDKYLLGQVERINCLCLSVWVCGQLIFCRFGNLCSCQILQHPAFHVVVVLRDDPHDHGIVREIGPGPLHCLFPLPGRQHQCPLKISLKLPDPVLPKQWFIFLFPISYFLLFFTINPFLPKALPSALRFFIRCSMFDVRPARNALACEAGGCSMFIFFLPFCPLTSVL